MGIGEFGAVVVNGTVDGNSEDGAGVGVSGRAPGRREATGGKRYNLHQFILPDASRPDLVGVGSCVCDAGASCVWGGGSSERTAKGDVVVEAKSVTSIVSV